MARKTKYGRVRICMVVSTHLEHGDKRPSSCVEDEVPEKYPGKYPRKTVDAVIWMGKDGEETRDQRSRGLGQLCTHRHSSATVFGLASTI
jgi:hypothetical protein